MDHRHAIVGLWALGLSLSNTSLAGPECRQDQMVPIPSNLPQGRALEELNLYYKNFVAAVWLSFYKAVDKVSQDERRFGFESGRPEQSGGSAQILLSDEGQMVRGRPMVCKGTVVTVRGTSQSHATRLITLPSLKDMEAGFVRIDGERASSDIKGVRKMSREQRDADDERLREMERIYLAHRLMTGRPEETTFRIRINATKWSEGAIVWGSPVTESGFHPKVVNVVMELEGTNGLVSSFMNPAVEALRDAMDGDVNTLLARGPQAGAEREVTAYRGNGVGWREQIASRKQVGDAAQKDVTAARGPAPASPARAAASPTEPAASPAPANTPAGSTGNAAKEVINNIPGQAGSILRGIFGR